MQGEAFRDTSFLADASSVVCISLLLSREMLTFLMDFICLFNDMLILDGWIKNTQISGTVISIASIFLRKLLTRPLICKISEFIDLALTRGPTEEGEFVNLMTLSLLFWGQVRLILGWKWPVSRADLVIRYLHTRHFIETPCLVRSSGI